MNQAELGRKAGLKQESISRLMNRTRKPNLQTVDKIASALDMKPWELFIDYDAGEVGPLSKNEETLISNLRAAPEEAYCKPIYDAAENLAKLAKRTRM
jgi:transcriptional regulator with XRE-family HTH domain